MRVGQNDGINFTGVKRKVAVLDGRLLAVALEHAEIKENPFPVHFNEMAGSRDLTCRTERLNFHVGVFSVYFVLL